MVKLNSVSLRSGIIAVLHFSLRSKFPAEHFASISHIHTGGQYDSSVRTAYLNGCYPLPITPLPDWRTIPYQLFRIYSGCCRVVLWQEAAPNRPDSDAFHLTATLRVCVIGPTSRFAIHLTAVELSSVAVITHCARACTRAARFPPA
jgi:hypothetical protein